MSCLLLSQNALNNQDIKRRGLFWHNFEISVGPISSRPTLNQCSITEEGGVRSVSHPKAHPRVVAFEYECWEISSVGFLIWALGKQVLFTRIITKSSSVTQGRKSQLEDTPCRNYFSCNR